MRPSRHLGMRRPQVVRQHTRGFPAVEKKGHVLFQASFEFLMAANIECSLVPICHSRLQKCSGIKLVFQTGKIQLDWPMRCIMRQTVHM